jgi:hypothetical protein
MSRTHPKNSYIIAVYWCNRLTGKKIIKGYMMSYSKRLDITSKRHQAALLPGIPERSEEQLFELFPRIKIVRFQILTPMIL